MYGLVWHGMVWYVCMYVCVYIYVIYVCVYIYIYLMNLYKSEW